MPTKVECRCSLRYTRSACDDFVGYKVKDQYGTFHVARTDKGPLCKACGHIRACHGIKVEVEDAGKREEWAVGEGTPREAKKEEVASPA